VSVAVVAWHQYEGTLVDGTVFDSSYKRGSPATFAPNQVIKGWTEAMQVPFPLRIFCAPLLDTFRFLLDLLVVLVDFPGFPGSGRVCTLTPDFLAILCVVLLGIAAHRWLPCVRMAGTPSHTRASS
jgi:hypothetical protein